MKKLLILLITILLTHTILTAQQTIDEVKNWAAQQKVNITAGEVVEFFNGGRAVGDITFGSEYVFNLENTSRCSAATLDSTHFVVAYLEPASGYNTTAIVGTVSGNIISYGSEYVFNYGNNIGTSYLSLTSLDDTHFAVAYGDVSNNEFGTVRIGTVSGDTISYGSEYVFNFAPTYYISIAKLDESHFVVAYFDGTGSPDGCAIIGSLTGETINYGAESVFCNGGAYGLSVSSLDNSCFIIAYHDVLDSSKGKAILGTVTNNSISFSSEYIFDTGWITSDISSDNIDSTHFVIAYKEYFNSYYGTAILGTKSGNSLSFSSKFVFNYANTSGISVKTMNESHIIIEYTDLGNSNYGSAIIGSISGDTIIYGPENVYSVNAQWSSITALDATNIVVAYKDGNNPGYGKATFGHVSSIVPVVSNFNSDVTCPGIESISVNIEYLDDATEFLLIFGYDTTNLTYSGYQNVNPQLNNGILSVTENNGEVTMSWLASANLNMYSETLLELLFMVDTTYAEVIENLIWDEANSYYIDNNGDTLASNFHNGQLTLNPITTGAGVITGADSVCKGASNQKYYIDSIPNATSYNWNIIPTTAATINDNDTSISIDFHPNAYGQAILYVNGENSCSIGPSSSVVINIINDLFVDAGSDSTIGDKSTYTLSGMASNEQSVLWTSLGDGIFDDSNSLTATYTPGNNDYEADSVVLSLEAHGLLACASDISDNITIHFQPEQLIDLFDGWNIISYYVTPNDMNHLHILQPLISSNMLVKVIDEAGNFIQEIPGFGWMNTIGNMVSTEGYYIKVNQNAQLSPYGILVNTPLDIGLSNGWNIMGYPTMDTINAIDILQPLIDSSQLTKVIDESGGFIQEIPGIGWVNTIGNFTPGEGYYIKVNQNCSLSVGADLPLVTTDIMTNITSTTATVIGNVSSDQGATVTARGVCWSTNTNPTLSDNYTLNGTGAGTFSSDITGLTANTQYYVRSYATNSIGTSYGNELILATINPNWQCGELLIDPRDGQTYNTVLIDNQCWMAENINLGTMISGYQNQINNSLFEKYCYDNIEDSCEVYGGLYQWDEVMQYTITEASQGICPANWHIPTDLEWKILEGVVDSYYPIGDPEWSYTGWRGHDAGKNLKSSNTWNENGSGTNSSGFTAISGGYRFNNGAYNGNNINGYWWTSSEGSGFNAWYRNLHSDFNSISRNSYDKEFGYSVRCLRDTPPNQPPNQPESPMPTDSAQNQAITVNLQWSCFDPEGDPLTFDVYFGTDTLPVLVATSVTDTTYDPGTLNYDTTYYWKIVVHDDHTNTTEGDVWQFSTETQSPPWQCGDTIVDPRDNQSYNTVQIGTQCWMAENLNFGSMITISSTNNGQVEKYCYNNNPTNCNVYGGLYQWDEMMQYSIIEGVQGVCPNGWHVPTDTEWTTITTYLSGTSVAGGKMKETGTAHWNLPNTGATNESGFTGLPGALRSSGGSFVYLGNNGYWWSSSEYLGSQAWLRQLYYDNEQVIRSNYDKTNGFSVRCLKD